jgi:hypothetical protein
MGSRLGPVQNLGKRRTAQSHAVSQRAIQARTAAGSALRDCVAPIDPATNAIVKAPGGIGAVVISHPHDDPSMVDWVRAFDCPLPRWRGWAPRRRASTSTPSMAPGGTG